MFKHHYGIAAAALAAGILVSGGDSLWNIAASAALIAFAGIVLHAFQSTKVDYKEYFGDTETTMQTATGQKHVEPFPLKKDGESNEDPSKRST